MPKIFPIFTFQDESKSYGVITISVKQETRPYTLKKVWNGELGSWVNVKGAIYAGILNEQTQMYTLIDEDAYQMTILKAIESGYIHADLHVCNL